MANILLISPWNTVCGVSEFAHFLVKALRARKHRVYVAANKFAGEYYPVTCRRDQEDCDGVERLFETGFQPSAIERTFFHGPRIEAMISKYAIDVVIVNYQDYIFCNKPALNELVSLTVANGTKVIFTFHDDCVSSTLKLPQKAVVVVPPSLSAMFGPTAITIDQGFPEFFGLTREPPQLPRDRWLLSCFGMGRNKLKQLVALITQLNGSCLDFATKKIHLQCFVAKPGQELPNVPCVTYTQSYLRPDHLALWLYNSHACIIWYPPIVGRSTSSAFRFATGSRVPIICNETNWVVDQLGNGCWLQASDDSYFGPALQALLSEDYDEYRAQMSAAQHAKVKASGWSVIVEQYERLF